MSMGSGWRSRAVNGLLVLALGIALLVGGALLWFGQQERVSDLLLLLLPLMVCGGLLLLLHGRQTSRSIRSQHRGRGAQ